ncbi:hypothetical protein BCR43DRAFT_499735 [Syncephalastrum racemosum]|uniref:Uncharacterized protein n=1 Tax=Syncephalastrum racemosum TaxID=13706 RepID=A0A1X2H0Q2_SYNRA|nr:hypothetical protein BCR43DRAFT_499735 [Syncephalastrum racemosum]
MKCSGKRKRGTPDQGKAPNRKMSLLSDQYEEAKTRNEQTLQAIRKLEYEVRDAENAIAIRRRRLACVRAYRQHLIHERQRHESYIALLSDIQQATASSHRRRRRVSSIFHDQVDQVCLQLEHRLMARVSRDTQTLEQDIRDLLHSPVALINTLTHLLSVQADRGSQLKTTPKHLHFKQQLKDLDQKLDKPQPPSADPTRHARDQLRKRVQQLYPDTTIRNALLQSYLAKADRHAAEARRQAMRDAIPRLERRAAHQNQDETELKALRAEADRIARGLADKHHRVQKMLAVNQTMHRTLISTALGDEIHADRHALLRQLEHACADLRGCVRKELDTFYQVSLRPNGMEPSTSTRIEQIKDNLNPSYRLSTQGVVDCLAALLIRANVLAAVSHDSPETRAELEGAAARWKEILDMHHIKIPERVSDEKSDAIDAIVQFADAFIAHFVDKKDDFISKHEEQLAKELNRLQHLNTDVLAVLGAIEERQLIENGELGMDYTFHDRPLQDWMAALEQQHNEES